MVCIYCGNETKVINSRHQKKLNQVWRRRKCTRCEAIFTTIESVETAQALAVAKDGTYEPFSRDKLLFSVYASLKHRKTAESDSTALTGTILSELIASTSKASVTRQTIIEITHKVLSRFDKAAATSYKAFHPSKES